jgi:CRP-like cAMP-binding protein
VTAVNNTGTMSPSILRKLHEHFRNSSVKTYAKGTIITHANHEPAGISLLLEGIVEQYDITPQGNKLTVNVFRPPAFFPMSWAINKTPNSYFFAALTDAKIKLADADKTVAFLRDNPDVMYDLLSRVYKGTDALLARLVVAASGIAASRLIFELLIEAYRFGVSIGDDQTLIKVGHNNLAARSGLARETVSRELHKLAAHNLVSLAKEGIIINTTQLEKQLDISF